MYYCKKIFNDVNSNVSTIVIEVTVLHFVPTAKALMHIDMHLLCWYQRSSTCGGSGSDGNEVYDQN